MHAAESWPVWEKGSRRGRAETRRLQQHTHRPARPPATEPRDAHRAGQAQSAVIHWRQLPAMQSSRAAGVHDSRRSIQNMGMQVFLPGSEHSHLTVVYLALFCRLVVVHTPAVGSHHRPEQLHAPQPEAKDGRERHTGTQGRHKLKRRQASPARVFPPLECRASLWPWAPEPPHTPASKRLRHRQEGLCMGSGLWRGVAKGRVGSPRTPTAASEGPP